MNYNDLAIERTNLTTEITFNEVVRILGSKRVPPHSGESKYEHLDEGEFILTDNSDWWISSDNEDKDTYTVEEFLIKHGVSTPIGGLSSTPNVIPHLGFKF